MSDVAIVILNWNGVEFLKKFIPTLQIYSSNYRIVVIDNASTDQSVQWLAEHHPSVQQILLDKNYGFCGGYNKGLAQVDAQYYVILNSDVEVTSGWLDRMINFLDAHPSVAACQPKIKSWYVRDYFEHAGAAGGFIDRLGYPFCRGRIFNAIEKDNGQYDDVVPIFWATGACLVIRSSVFHEVGGFDDRFFAHMEEIDLCWRIQQAGHQIYYYGLSTVYHVGGGTLPKSNPHKTYLNFRNGIALMFKNTPSSKIIPVLLIRLVLDGVAAFKFLFGGGVKDFWAVFRAHISFYGMLPYLVSQRKKRQVSDLTSSYSNTYNGSVVFDFFVKGIKTYRELR